MSELIRGSPLAPDESPCHFAMHGTENRPLDLHGYPVRSGERKPWTAEFCWMFTADTSSGFSP